MPDQNTRHCEYCGGELIPESGGDLCRPCNKLFFRLVRRSPEERDKHLGNYAKVEDMNAPGAIERHLAAYYAGIASNDPIRYKLATNPSLPGRNLQPIPEPEGATMTAENPNFGPKGVETAAEAMARAEGITQEEVRRRGDQHLQSLTIEKTKAGKVYDHLLGVICEGLQPMPGMATPALDGGSACFVLVALASTEGYIELPNRKKLLSIVEQSKGGGR